MPAKGLGVHHVDLAVSDVERSLAFYLELLGPLGWQVAVRYPTYRGTEDVVYLGTPAEPGVGRFGLRQADGGEHRYYGVGVEHLAFEADTRQEVDEAFARAKAAGAEIHFPPEFDRDEPGYYAVFVFDPDGIRVEVFAWTPGDDGGARPMTQQGPANSSHPTSTSPGNGEAAQP
jgi:catechol 2,3-dioxygenase-like lactoylglutathione lyase family enzyme